MITLLGIAAALLLSPFGKVEEVEFYQLDIDFGGHPMIDSDWESMRLTYVGAPHPLYLNVSVNDQWVVQNIAVMSAQGAGEINIQDFNFPTGSPPGVDIRQVLYGVTLTRDLAGQPRSLFAAQVQPRNYLIHSGVGGGALEIMPATPLLGFLLCEEVYKHEGFPNQDCGVNECVPAAVSNSLLFLKKKHNLAYTDKEVSIANMKAATGWKGERDGCDPNNWYKNKDKYCSLKKGNGPPRLPIKTTYVNNTEPEKVRDAICDGCDVELLTVGQNSQGHCVAITGVALRCDGKYIFEVSHDSEQGVRDKGTVTETVVYTGSSSKLEGGGPWANGQKVKHFVIECPIR